MKKINLTIAEPCHEKWDHMTQADKGKFCNACQKTVIDFTNMSDRQLAEFFKKPKANVCGRFYNDQLERPIDISKKRLPWIKYFFQFTWPAFLFFLKSCTDRGQTIGEPISQKVEQKSEVKSVPITLGGIGFTEVTSPETITTKTINESMIMGDLIIEEQIVPPDTSWIGEGKAPFKNDEPIIETAPLDSITVVFNERLYKKNTVMGAISTLTACSVTTAKPPVIENFKTMKESESTNAFKIFPNPVRAGSMVTIQFSENNIPGQVQIISSTGQLISSMIQTKQEYATMCNIRIPDNVSSGVYFIRLTGDGKILQTSKLIITK